MVFDLQTISILTGFGFLAGFIDSIAGGGGLITLPTLLMVGVPPHLALGTNKLASTFGSFNAARAFIKKKIFNPLIWKAAMVATLVGAIIGVLLAHLIATDILKKFLPILILCVAIYIIFSPLKKLTKPHSRETLKPNTKSSVITGVVLGCYDGFLGPGTGSFWTTIVMSLYKLDLLTASGVARVMNFVSNIVALITFMLLKSVDYKIGICMGIALMLGAQIGAHSAIRFGARFIRPVFLTVVIVMAVRMIWGQFL